MAQEEFHEPTEEEINKAVGEAKGQIEEYYNSQPTEENINKAMTDIAAQFGEKFEAGDPAVPEEEIIEKYVNEGWRLAGTQSNSEPLKIGEKEGKDVKIIGLGDKFLIFERED